MVETKSVEATVSKWTKRVGVSEPDYKEGIARAKDWQGKTLERKDAFVTGVTAADIGDKFAKGVGEVPTEEWRRKTTDKSPRWKQGVNVAAPEFRSGISNVLGTIQGVTLTPKGPAGSAENYDRVKQIGDALHKMKTGGA